MKPSRKNFGPEPAIGLKLAQIVEQTAQGVVGRRAGAIDVGLGGEIGAVFSFGYHAAVKAPGDAHDFDGQHFFDSADRVEVFPKGFWRVCCIRRFLRAGHSFGCRRGRI